MVPGVVEEILLNVMKISRDSNGGYVFLLISSLVFSPVNLIIFYKHEEPIEAIIVMTILTIRSRCPKTVNLFNKAHQHI